MFGNLPPECGKFSRNSSLVNLPKGKEAPNPNSPNSQRTNQRVAREQLETKNPSQMLPQRLFKNVDQETKAKTTLADLVAATFPNQSPEEVSVLTQGIRDDNIQCC